MPLLPSDTWTVDQVFRAMVDADLDNWSVQGFGMLRLYVGPNTRINVWDPTQRVRLSVTPHDHPWHFKSQVVVGSMANHRYVESPGRGCGHEFVRHTIFCGDLPHLVGQKVVGLIPAFTQRFTAGQSYKMRASDIHWSDVAPGTVTLLEKTELPSPNNDIANIYLPQGEEWRTVKARPATMDEVTRYLKLADQARDYVPV